MPRKPRLHYPGALYHVMLRGNSGQDIFFDDGDYMRFFLLLQQAAERHGCRIHAYCLMTNHLHLALQVGEVPLSRIMQNVGFRYTQHINRKYSRSGHLFQGRYKALLVDADSYLLELIRYIHLNPIRIGLAALPEDYPWSSHGHYLGITPVPPWVVVQWALSQFGETSQVAIARFATFVRDGMGEGHRSDFHRGTFEGRALGDERFVENALLRANEGCEVKVALEQIVESVCTDYGLRLAEFCRAGKMQPAAEARALAALLVRNAPGVTLQGLAAFLGRDLSSLSQAARRLELRILEDGELCRRVSRIEAKVRNPGCQT